MTKTCKYKKCGQKFETQKKLYQIYCCHDHKELAKRERRKERVCLGLVKNPIGRPREKYGLYQKNTEINHAVTNFLLKKIGICREDVMELSGVAL